MDDKQYVRSRWERAEECPRPRPADDPTWCISLGGRRFTVANVPETDAETEVAAWSAARAFTEEREKQIAKIAQEIRWLMNRLDEEAEDAGIVTSIIAREQAEVNELKRGMKA